MLKIFRALCRYRPGIETTEYDVTSTCDETTGDGEAKTDTEGCRLESGQLTRWPSLNWEHFRQPVAKKNQSDLFVPKRPKLSMIK